MIMPVRSQEGPRGDFEVLPRIRAFARWDAGCGRMDA